MFYFPIEMLIPSIILRFFTLFSVLNNFRNAIKFNLFIIFFHEGKMFQYVL